MLVDRYTKIVLTVIALALAALAIGQFRPHPASAQLGNGCGTMTNPCYVTNEGIALLDVYAFGAN